MHRHSFITIAVVLLLGGGACGTDTRSPVGPEPLPPLEPASWHVHQVGGQLLPALVAERTVGPSLERTYLDSARFIITDDGRWEQRVHLVRFLGSVPHGSALQQDAGTWAVTDSGYLFTSDAHGAGSVVAAVPVDSLALTLRIEGTTGTVTAVLRRQPPPPTPAGDWTAAALADVPLPARIFLWDPFVEDGREISVHLIVDSARLALHANGRYDHRIWTSEWEGDAGGPPLRLRLRSMLGDFGGWTRNGIQLQLESWWLQNHSLSGEFANDALHMQHGLTHGEPPFPFRYVR
jgi:hypothetical protein